MCLCDCDRRWLSHWILCDGVTVSFMLITRIINDTRFVVIYRYYLGVDQCNDTAIHSIRTNTQAQNPIISGSRNRRRRRQRISGFAHFFRLSLLNRQEIDLFHGDKHLNKDMRTKCMR